MNTTSDVAPENHSGWKPIPLPLKILSVIFILWLLGSLMNLPNLFENGLPLFGQFVYGVVAAFVVLLLDIVGPIVFLVALWLRKWWAPRWAYAYIGLFIINNLVALLTLSDQLGLPQILVPLIVSSLFLLTIFWQRDYFKAPS